MGSKKARFSAKLRPAGWYVYDGKRPVSGPWSMLEAAVRASKLNDKPYGKRGVR